MIYVSLVLGAIYGS
ncbi:hypothetical protein F383_39430 [Gossypium arboreum]|uniref:Uncharacterized protein n=1 Tax=Gossypium arboreum TaxID=29729 RepID=A0A0B0MQE2_GOSAR|nr:hypothetical protein F383_39430 [Gossypium arboreum]